MRRILPLMLAVLALPVASASGSLDAGFVVVVIDNGHETDCVEDATGLCVATLRGSQPESMEVDANQQIRSVGVALNRSRLNDAAGREIVGETALVVDSSALRLPNPTFRILTENVGTQHAPAPANDTAVIFDAEGFGVAYEGFELGNLSGGPTPRRWYFAYSEGQGVGYDHVSLYGTLAESSTDDQARLWLGAECWAIDVGWCTGLGRSSASAAADALPNLVVGIDVDAAAAATDPTLLAGENDTTRAAADFAAAPRTRSIAPARPLTWPTMGPEPFPLRAPRSSYWPGPATPAPHAPAEPTLRGLTNQRVVPQAPSMPLSIAVTILVLALAAAAMYSRVTRREEALLHERRLAMLALLAEHGPLPFAEVGRRLGVDRTTVEHHARLLRRTEHVRLERVGRNLFVALPGQELPADELGAGEAAAAIVDILRQRGGALPRVDLQKAASKFPARSRNEALRRLASRGHVERAFAGAVEVIRLSTASRQPAGTAAEAATPVDARGRP